MRDDDGVVEDPTLVQRILGESKERTLIDETAQRIFEAAELEYWPVRIEIPPDKDPNWIDISYAVGEDPKNTELKIHYDGDDPKDCGVSYSRNLFCIPEEHDGVIDLSLNYGLYALYKEGLADLLVDLGRYEGTEIYVEIGMHLEDQVVYIEVGLNGYVIDGSAEHIAKDQETGAFIAEVHKKVDDYLNHAKQSRLVIDLPDAEL